MYRLTILAVLAVLAAPHIFGLIEMFPVWGAAGLVAGVGAVGVVVRDMWEK